MNGANNPDEDRKHRAVREALEIIHGISKVLNTGLSKKQLASCVSLIHNGVHPETLATLIKTLRAEYPPEEQSDDRIRRQVN